MPDNGLISEEYKKYSLEGFNREALTIGDIDNF